MYKDLRWILCYSCTQCSCYCLIWDTAFLSEFRCLVCCMGELLDVLTFHKEAPASRRMLCWCLVWPMGFLFKVQLNMCKCTSVHCVDLWEILRYILLAGSVQSEVCRDRPTASQWLQQVDLLTCIALIIIISCQSMCWNFVAFHITNND